MFTHTSKLVLFIIFPKSDHAPVRKLSSSPIKKPPGSPPSKSGSLIRIGTTAKQSLEIQFKTKKKRLDMLKRELIGKQKPVLELYQALVELKRKLEQTGTHPQLEELKFIDCEYKEETDPNAGGEAKIDSEALESLRALVQKLVFPVLSYCKNVIVKRSDILETLETNPDVAKARIPSLKIESEEMEKNLEEMRNEQEKNIASVVNFFQKALEYSNTTLELPSKFTDEGEVEQLKQLLQEKERLLFEANKVMQELQDEAKKRTSVQDELNKYKHHANDMKQKIKVSKWNGYGNVTFENFPSN